MIEGYLVLHGRSVLWPIYQWSVVTTVILVAVYLTVPIVVSLETGSVSGLSTDSIVCGSNTTMFRDSWIGAHLYMRVLASLGKQA